MVLSLDNKVSMVHYGKTSPVWKCEGKFLKNILLRIKAGKMLLRSV